MRVSHISTAAVTVALGLTLAACGGQKDAAPTPASPSAAMSMSMAPSTAMSAPAAMSTAAFESMNGKKVMGTARIDGAKIELTGYSSDEGPDLHLYLTNGTSETDVKGGVRLGTIAFDKATQSFSLPSGTSASSYKYLVVHCDKAQAVFGAAALAR